MGAIENRIKRIIADAEMVHGPLLHNLRHIRILLVTLILLVIIDIGMHVIAMTR